MKIAPSNILAHELIGLNLRVVSSRDPTLNNVEGKVVYETRKILQIYWNGRVKSIPKDICRFALHLPQGVVEVDGAKLVAKPEDRVKKLRLRAK
jgi:ribonuclease P protein subunit POP4